MKEIITGFRKLLFLSLISRDENIHCDESHEFIDEKAYLVKNSNSLDLKQQRGKL